MAQAPRNKHTPMLSSRVRSAPLRDARPLLIDLRGLFLLPLPLGEGTLWHLSSSNHANVRRTHSTQRPLVVAAYFAGIASFAAARASSGKNFSIFGVTSCRRISLSQMLWMRGS